MDWDKLKAFYRVAKIGSFTIAAEGMNRSQSAVSRQIICLEERLGVTLFIRHPKGVSLTKHGEILLKTVEGVFKDLESVETSIKEDGSKPKGLLKIAATSGFASLYLTQHIKGFQQRFPEIKLAIMGKDIAPDLSLQEADVLIHPYIHDIPGLIQHKLMDYHFKLYASPDYLNKFGTPKTLEDLDHHRLITYGEYLTHPFNYSNWHLVKGSKSGQVRKPFMEINTSYGLGRIASDGLGIVSLAEEHPDLENLNLVQILPEVEGPVIGAYYIYSEQLKKSQRVQAFSNYLQEVFTKDSQKMCASG